MPASTAREHAMANQASERDPQASNREARAEQYFEQDLKGQRRWYSERASTYKQRTQVLGLLVIGAGAATSFGGFEICIDGLSIWLMRIGREIGRGTSVQALRERRACQERADAQQAALPVQGLRPELHRHASTRQAAGPEGGGRAALCQRSVDE